MAFNSVPQGWIAVGKALVQSLFQRMKDDLDWLYSGIGGLAAANVPNGSMEIDGDADNVPDNWDRNLYPAGNGVLVSADGTVGGGDGAKIFKFSRLDGTSDPTRGGGDLTSDYLECSFVELIHLGVLFRSTAAAVRNRVLIKFYGHDKVEIASQWLYTNGTGRLLWESTANPTTWTWLRILNVGVPIGARFYKVVLVGGAPDATFLDAADIYFDRVKTTPSAMGHATLAETIDRGETSAGGNFLYQDIAGSAYNITIPPYVKWLKILGDVKTNAMDPAAAKIRFRIGANYSSVVQGDGVNYVTGTMVLNVSALAGPQTVQLQWEHNPAAPSDTIWMRLPATHLKYYEPGSITVDAFALTTSET